MKIDINPKLFIGKMFRYCGVFNYEIYSIDNTGKYYNLIYLSKGNMVKLSIKDFERRLLNKSIIIL